MNELDLEALRGSIRDVLDRECGTDAVLRHIASGAAFDRALWDRAAALGWLGLAVPERHGGLGLGAAALGVLYEEAGRAVAPVPLLGTLLAGEALALAGSAPQQARWLPSLAAGGLRATISPPGRPPRIRAHRDGDAILLDGHEDQLVDGAPADLAVILTDLGPVVVEPAGDGVAVVRFQPADLTRTLGEMTFTALRLPADRLLAVVDREASDAALVAHAMLGIACDARGGGTAILERTIDYLKLREQFGRPIGSFQALKHRCADHKAALVATDELVRRAIDAKEAASSPDLLPMLAAKLRAGKTFADVAADAVQLHGGIGFTWEQPCHLFLKRAKLDEQMFGSAAALADRIAASLAVAPPSLEAPIVRRAGFDPLARRGDPEAFRAELRDWLAARAPADWVERMRGADDAAYRAFQNEWLAEVRAVRLATPHWPKEWGGEDLTLAQKIVIYEEFARADAPDLAMFVIALHHLPATLFARGTPAQRDRYLRAVIDDDEVWVQGFSEPGAGSDLAALRTRAERTAKPDGRVVYVVNGQKIWSSYGQFARRMLLLARTDPAARRKQSGISYFICDMDAPGITVRPIRQITGDAEFNEVFFDDVEIPEENLIGAENEGWAIAQSTLSAERGLIVFGLIERAARALMRDFTDGRGTWLEDDQHRRAWVSSWIDFQAVRLLARRMLIEVEANPHMNAGAASYVKLVWATTLHRYTALMLEVAGVDGQRWQPSITGGGAMTGLPMNDFLRSYAWTISGGTNEIMRNIIAERFLGLPKEPRGDPAGLAA